MFNLDKYIAGTESIVKGFGEMDLDDGIAGAIAVEKAYALLTVTEELRDTLFSLQSEMAGAPTPLTAELFAMRLNTVGKGLVNYSTEDIFSVDHYSAESIGDALFAATEAAVVLVTKLITTITNFFKGFFRMTVRRTEQTNALIYKLKRTVDDGNDVVAAIELSGKLAPLMSSLMFPTISFLRTQLSEEASRINIIGGDAMVAFLKSKENLTTEAVMALISTELSQTTAKVSSGKSGGNYVEIGGLLSGAGGLHIVTTKGKESSYVRHSTAGSGTTSVMFTKDVLMDMAKSVRAGFQALTKGESRMSDFSKLAKDAVKELKASDAAASKEAGKSIKLLIYFLKNEQTYHYDLLTASLAFLNKLFTKGNFKTK